jgi:hypothetical protein
LAGNPLGDGAAQVFAFERTLWGEPVDVLPPGLEALVTESGCQGIGARWIVEREDLERDDFAD